jgi:hypothetical protein
MKYLLLLAALLAFGCDSSTVHDNIDVFTCAYLPWWMADCESSEVHDKAIRILDHGLIEAQVTCVADAHCAAFNGSTNGYKAKLKATLLADGSKAMSCNFGEWGGADPFIDRSEALSADFASDDFGFLRCAVASGSATVEMTGTLCGTGPFKTFDISTDCTGFNLTAFGASP